MKGLYAYNTLQNVKNKLKLIFRSDVGNINAELTLTDRTDVCKSCGMVKNRDVNAAENLNKVGKARPEPTDACGHDGSVSVAHVTEATSMVKQEAKG